MDETNNELTDLKAPNIAFQQFASNLSKRSEIFEKFLQDESDSNVKHNTESLETVRQSYLSLQLMKDNILKEIDEDELRDVELLQKFSLEQESQNIPDTERTSSVLSYMTLPGDIEVEEFGSLTARAENMAMQDLYLLVEDQKQDFDRWASHTDYTERPMPARLQKIGEENRKFFDIHSNPVLHEDVVNKADDDIYDIASNMTLEEIEAETAILRKELEDRQSLVKEERLKKETAAVLTIQSFFRGVRVRRQYSDELKKRVADAKQRMFDERVKAIELERTRLAELKLLEEEKIRNEKERVESEKRRKEAEAQRIAEEKAAEESRKKAEEKVTEERRKQAELEAEQRRKLAAQEAELKRIAEEQLIMAKKEAEARRIDEEKKAIEKRLVEEKRKQAELEAEAKRLAQKKANEERLKKEEVEAKAKEKAPQNDKISSETRHFPASPRQSAEPSYRPKSSARASLSESRKSTKSKNSIENTPRKVEVTKPKPKVMVDPEVVKARQMTWMKECSSWSSTVAQLKIAPVRLGGAGFKVSSASKSAVKPPEDCKNPKIAEILKPFGRTLPPVNQITSLCLSNLQNQFDLSALSTLSNLLCLDISNSGFTYLANLEGCSNLVYLNASGNKIKELDLNRVETLTYLDISHNNITSLAGISNCIGLSSLKASYNRIVRLGLTIRPNVFFWRIHSLDLGHNQLLNTREWLASMLSLVSLDLSTNNLRGVDDLTRLGLLQFINVSYNSLSSLPDLSNCPLLVDANFSGNNLHSVDLISTFFLPHLIRLDISRNMLTNISKIENLINLIEIRLENNQIVTFQALMNQSGLTKLPRLKFVRGDFLCFSTDDVAKLNKMLKTERDIELISADYDDLISLCSTLKLLITPGLIDDDEDAPADDYQEFCRFVVLLQENLTGEVSQVNSDRSKKSQHRVIEKQWDCYRKYFEESAKGAQERRYAIEFCETETTPVVEPSTEKTRHIVPEKPPAKLETPTPPKVKTETSKNQEKAEATKKKDQRRQLAAIVIQTCWRGFLARFEIAQWQVAATIIQKHWRGYWVRKQIQSVLDAYMNEPSMGDGEDPTGEVDKSVDDLMSFLSGIQSMTDSVSMVGSRSNSRAVVDHREAWNTPTHSARQEQRVVSDSMDLPLPGPQDFLEIPRQNAAESIHSERQVSKKVQHIQDEWGFANSSTVDLMMKRANRMKQAEKNKKIAKMNAHQRLNLARKQAAVVETHYQPNLPTDRRVGYESSRDQYPIHEVHLGDNVVISSRMESPNPSESSHSASSRQQNQTFSWVHSVIREPSPMTPLPQVGVFPPISTGGFMTNYEGFDNSQNRTSANSGSGRHGPTNFPPIIKNNSASYKSHQPSVPAPQSSEEKPKKRDLIRAWREPAVRLSGGWGGGRPVMKKKK